MQKTVIAALCLAFAMSGASAQQQAARQVSPPSTTTADFLAQGYEIKGVINNTYLLLQKGERTFLCGNPDGLTWTNWAEHTRDGPCKSMTRAN
jgi:hypothetical protein